MRWLALLTILVFAFACNDAPVAPDGAEVQAMAKASSAGTRGLVYVKIADRIYVLDTETDALVDQIELPAGSGYALEVSPDSKTLWVGSTVYRIPQHTVRHQFGFPAGPPEFSGDGKRAYLVSGQELLTIHAKSFRVVNKANLGFSPLLGWIEVSPAGDVAYMVSNDYLRLVEPSSGTLMEEFYLPPLLNYDAGVPVIGEIALKPDGSELWMPISLAYGNGVFDTQARTFANVPCGEYGEVDFSPDGSVVYVSDNQGGICVFDGPGISDPLGYLSGATSFDVSPDGTLLYSLTRWGDKCVVKVDVPQSVVTAGIDPPTCEKDRRGIVVAQRGG